MNLQLENLILRDLTLADAAAMLEAMDCPEVSEMYGYGFDSIEKVVSYLELIVSEYQRGVYRTFGIAERSTNHLIGSLTIDQAPMFARIEYSYWINKDYRGRGYATEAVKGMNTYCFESLSANRIQAFTSNPISEKVLKKAGMVYEGTLRQYFGFDGHYRDAKMYSLLREEYVEA